MSLAPNAPTDLSALQDDLTAVKNDVARLVTSLTASATKGAESAATQVNESAQHLYQDAAAKSGEAMKGLSKRIEEQPLMALLFAVGIGYIGGRILSR
eukprot:gene5923-7853_t